MNIYKIVFSISVKCKLSLAFLTLTSLSSDFVVIEYFISLLSTFKFQISNMTPRIITLKELNQHNKSQDLWISIADKVYDCSVFADMVGYIYINHEIRIIIII